MKRPHSLTLPGKGRSALRPYDTPFLMMRFPEHYLNGYILQTDAPSCQS